MLDATSSYNTVSPDNLKDNLADNYNGKAANKHRTSAFSHIPEAASMTWTDSFYDGTHGIVAVLDRHAEITGHWMMRKNASVALLFFGLALLRFALSASNILMGKTKHHCDALSGIILSAFGVVLILMGIRSSNAMRTQHVAVTVEGVRIDEGTTSSAMIPFEHLYECKDKRACPQSADFETIILFHRVSPLEQSFCIQSKRRELHGIVRAREFVALVHAMEIAKGHGTRKGVVPRKGWVLRSGNLTWSLW